MSITAILVHARQNIKSYFVNPNQVNIREILIEEDLEQPKKEEEPPHQTMEVESSQVEKKVGWFSSAKGWVSKTFRSMWYRS